MIGACDGASQHVAVMVPNIALKRLWRLHIIRGGMITWQTPVHDISMISKPTPWEEHFLKTILAFQVTQILPQITELQSRLVWERF